jgi:hypothetical protein
MMSAELILIHSDPAEVLAETARIMNDPKNAAILAGISSAIDHWLGRERKPNTARAQRRRVKAAQEASRLARHTKKLARRGGQSA